MIERDVLEWSKIQFSGKAIFFRTVFITLKNYLPGKYLKK
jgi:hypothetical protein